MRPLIFATLAMFSLPACTLAQPQPPSAAATVQPDPSGNLAGAHTSQTTGGESDNPAPHIYKKGEHITRTYGAFDDVKNWAQFDLPRPPDGSHWVHYADNYLLVRDDSGLITDIVVKKS